MAEERATLIVGGSKFEDWESVWLQKTWGDGFHQFRFTAAERELAAAGYAQLQIKPEDECTIELAGEQAINGIVLTRQAAYDEANHGVMFQGVSNTWAAAGSSIIHKTNSFDEKSFMQIVKEVLKDTGVKFKTFGKISEKPFKRAHTHPGEPIFDFLKRYAAVRKVIVACNKEGEFVFIGEEHPSENIGSLIEGVNIRRCQATISVSASRSDFILINSSAATDSQHGTKASEQNTKEKGTLTKIRRPLIIPNEQPTWTKEELELRAKNEKMWTEQHQVQATIVVQGWTSGGGKLWEEGKDVSVKSKMAMLDMDLSIQSVTYTQDNNSGTLTTMLLVAPWGLNGKEGLGKGLGSTLGNTLDRTPGSPD